MYIWLVAQKHNINNYLDQIQQENQITIDPSKVLGQVSQTKNAHVLSFNLDKHVFHNNHNFFFIKYFYIYVGNTLLIDDTPYKSMFNGPYTAIFEKSFDGYGRDDNYLLHIILPYLEYLHHSKYGVITFVYDNPFGRIKSVTCHSILDNIKCYTNIVVICVMCHIVQM